MYSRQRSPSETRAFGQHVMTRTRNGTVATNMNNQERMIAGRSGPISEAGTGAMDISLNSNTPGCSFRLFRYKARICVCFGNAVRTESSTLFLLLVPLRCSSCWLQDFIVIPSGLHLFMLFLRRRPFLWWAFPNRLILGDLVHLLQHCPCASCVQRHSC